jgi:hypothetical protein
MKYINLELPLIQVKIYDKVGPKTCEIHMNFLSSTFLMDSVVVYDVLNDWARCKKLCSFYGSYAAMRGLVSSHEVGSVPVTAWFLTVVFLAGMFV